jgi:hypothetical protein
MGGNKSVYGDRQQQRFGRTLPMPETTIATASAPRKASAKAKPKAPAKTKAKSKGKAAAKVAKALARPSATLDRVLAMLRGPGGVTIADISEAMHWLPHTTRAYISKGGPAGKAATISSQQIEVDGKKIRVYKAD